MKHEQQSLITKKAISQALKELMKTKPLNRITINEIAAQCDINRKTFYYHFEDIYCLLKWTLENEAIAQFDTFDLVTQHNDAVEFALDYISENRAMLRNIVHSIGRTELSRYFFNDIYKPVYNLVCTSAALRKLAASEDYRAFLSRFLTEAIAGMLVDCIEHEPASRAALTRQIDITLTASITSSLESAAKENM